MRTSLASRTHFEVLGLGLENFLKSFHFEVLLKSFHFEVLVLGLRTALFFKWLKSCRSAKKRFCKPFFLDRRKKNFEDLFLWKTLAFVTLVLGLGLGHFCLALASDFFVSLALASSLVSSTPPLGTNPQMNLPKNPFLKAKFTK